MIAAIRAEALRLLRPRLVLATVVPVAVIAVIGTAVNQLGARLPASAGGIDLAARVMLPGPNGLVVGVFGPATVFLGAVSAALAATLLGSDFRSGTIRPQLIAHPARYSFLAGKLAVLAAYLLV
ncbi:MAG: hypothetical protein J2P45_20605, partial [Candidatus Dormibacteraeota bacterium]|nr:hypothetical protein [Candidatus Dormibacteraeota bacterium]